MRKKLLITLLAGLVYTTLCGFTVTEHYSLDEDGSYRGGKIYKYTLTEEEKEWQNKLRQKQYEEGTMIENAENSNERRLPDTDKYVYSRYNCIMVDMQKAHDEALECIPLDYLNMITELNHPLEYTCVLERDYVCSLYRGDIIVYPGEWTGMHETTHHYNPNAETRYGNLINGQKVDITNLAIYSDECWVHGYWDKTKPEIMLKSNYKVSKKNGYKVYNAKRLRSYCRDDVGISNIEINGRGVIDYPEEFFKKNKLNVLSMKDYSGKKTTVKFYTDSKAPTVKGVENKKTYTKNLTLYIKDNLAGVQSIKIDWKKVNTKKVSSGKYKGYYKVTVGKSSTPKQHVLIVTDKVENTKKITFKN